MNTFFEGDDLSCEWLHRRIEEKIDVENCLGI